MWKTQGRGKHTIRPSTKTFLEPPPWAREIGTICQIAFFRGNGAFVWSKKGSFSAIPHCVFNECRPSTVFYSIANFVVRNRQTLPFLGPPKMLHSAEKRQFDEWYLFHACTPPPPMIHFSPFGDDLSFPLEEMGAKQTNGALYGKFPLSLPKIA